MPFWAVFEGNGWLLIKSAADFHSPIPNYAADPTEWTTSRLLLPALYGHLAALPSLDAATTAAARTFASEVLQVARADNLVYRITVPIADVDIRGPASTVLGANGVTIRRLSPAEQGQLLMDWGGYVRRRHFYGIATGGAPDRCIHGS